MLKVAIVGCGKIADQHVEQIVLIPGCEIVGVCDREELMARQLQERLNVGAYFTEVQDLLDKATPDVVHITTPPQSHYPVAKLCLQAGCHVYIEKPFTVDAAEAEQLISLAERKGLKLTVGHNAQFTHAAIRMRRLIEEGYLGGPPVHMESYYCYDLRDAAYAKALLGDSHHWVRKLPGGLLQNVISHGISKIAEFLTGDSPAVLAYGFTSPLLRSIGETEIDDELPVIRMKGSRYKSYLEQFVPPWGYAKQYIGNSLGNMTKFLKADFQTGYSMKVLIRKFYRSITDGLALPIPYTEILRTARIMDEIFTQLSSAQNALRAGQSKNVPVER